MAQVIPLLSVHLAEVLHDVEEHGDQEAAGTAGGVDHRFPRLRSQALDDPVNQRPGREVLAGPALGVTGIPFQQPFVGITLDVGAEDHPALLVEQVGDQSLEFGGILDLVLGLAENQPEQAVLFAEVLQHTVVLDFQLHAVLSHQGAPVLPLRYG